MVHETMQHLSEFVQKVKDLGGVVDFDLNDELTVSSFNDKAIMLSVHLDKPATDDNCVASIDWLGDKRYDGRRTFDVATYNENFNLSHKDLKRAGKLQKLTVKYSSKFFRDENY